MGKPSVRRNAHDAAPTSREPCPACHVISLVLVTSDEVCNSRPPVRARKLRDGTADLSACSAAVDARATLALACAPMIGVWTLAYFAAGAAVGFLAGLLGIGGGMTLVPVLAAMFTAQHFAPAHTVHLALGTGMATIVFTSSSSV